MGLPTEEYGSTPEEYATPQESCENQSFILKEFHIFFILALKEILNFNNLPLENSWPLALHQEGTDIKCN